jgi:hypothetical protein
MKNIYSTLNTDVTYAVWQTNHGHNSIQKKVLVRGKAGVAAVGTGPRVYTPMGVRTEVSDEDATLLAEHGIFKEHQKRGHVRIEDIAKDADKVAQKMEPDTGAAPQTPADVKKAAEEAAKKSGLKPEETLQVVTNKGK